MSNHTDDLDQEISRQSEEPERRTRPTRNGKPELTASEERLAVQEDKLDTIIESLRGSGFVFALWRKRVFDADFCFVAKLSADDFDVELIKQQHGGGRYNIRVTDKEGKFRNNFSFSIDENFKGRTEGSNGDKNGVDTIALARTVAEIANNKKDDSGLMMTMMERQSQQSQNFLALMLQMQTENSKAMMGMMSAMFSGNNNRNSGDGFGSAITPILIKMIESSSNRQPDAFDIDKLIKIREFLTPAEAEKPSIFDRLLDVAPSVLPLFMGGKMGMNPQMLPDMSSSAVPQPVALPQQVTAAPCPPAAGEAPLPQHAPNEKPKIELVPLLKRGAEMDSDPASYAVIVLDIVGEANEDQLITFLNTTEWRKLFTGFNDAEMKWVDEWRKEVLEMTEDEPEEKGEESKV